MIRAKIHRPAGSSRALVLGFVLAALLAASLMLDAKPAHADATFTVTRTDDSEDPDPGDGECGFFAGRGGQVCTLRAAIQEANASAGADTIEFNLPDDPNEPGKEVKTILPGSSLPEITEQLVIDGYSQPGSRPNSRASGAIDAVILVELDGLNAGSLTPGLNIRASNVVVRGLAINRFKNGIDVDRGTGSRVEGNFIGTDASGILDLGNDSFGVNILGGGKHTVGGTTPDKRNLISGNNNSAVELSAQGGNKVQGNIMGTRKDGTTLVGGTEEGVFVNSPNNTIGGAKPGAGNIIAFNSDQGVFVDVFTANRILGNSIFGNRGRGIDLDGESLGREQDPGDRDKGSNNLQNFPVLSSAVRSEDGTTTIKGTLDSTPNKKFTVQFFSNPQNEDGGKTFLGQKKVTTNRQGKASFTFETTRRPEGDRITATATGPGGNTSEFSDPLGLSSP